MFALDELERAFYECYEIVKQSLTVKESSIVYNCGQRQIRMLEKDREIYSYRVGRNKSSRRKGLRLYTASLIRRQLDETNKSLSEFSRVEIDSRKIMETIITLVGGIFLSHNIIRPKPNIMTK